nr:MAG TPA: hypothetical protein [Caudoviricetes sp.]
MREAVRYILGYRTTKCYQNTQIMMQITSNINRYEVFI